MDNDKIIFSFEGGMATNHELSFYESSRFQYAAARLIYKLEHFRQTGKILERVSEKIDADIRVSAAKEGSWELEIALASIPALGLSLSVPLNVLLGYILNSVKPKSKGQDIAVQLARIELARERERTKQGHIDASRLRSLENIVRSQSATVKEALSLLKDRSYADVDKACPNIIESKEELEFIKDELRAEKKYQKMIEPYEAELNNIPAEKIVKLTDMFRKSSKELAYPLRSSATSLSVSFNRNNEFCVFNRESLEGIADEIQDKIPTYLEGSIKMYDKETGWGKFRNNEQFYKPIPFMVPAGTKKNNLTKISKALASPLMGANFYIVRNSSKEPIRLILDKIVETRIDDTDPLS